MRVEMFAQMPLKINPDQQADKRAAPNGEDCEGDPTTKAVYKVK